MKNSVLIAPEADPFGFVKTLNGMGYMTSTLDPFSREFVEYASGTALPALDVGAAFGVAALEALSRGGQVIANDIDPDHLKILESRAKEKDKTRLTLLPGSFPDELQVRHGSLGSVLICRVLHFFMPDEVDLAFRKVFEWLAPGGKLFVVSETPYVGTMTKFIPIYEQRKSAGELWPGVVDIATVDPELLKVLPPKMHLLDPEVLRRSAEKAGFKVEKTNMISRSDFPPYLQLDGRESVGLVAKKVK